MKTKLTRVLTALVMLVAPVAVTWGQEENEKFSITTQMFLSGQKKQAENPAASRPTRMRRLPGSKVRPKHRRLIATPDTVDGVAYIPCFVHLKNAADLGAVRALGVEVEQTFDGLDFVAARVPADQLEPLAAIDNVTRIKVARPMRPLTDVARQTTNAADLLTQSADALALGVTDKYDGTGVILGIIDTGIDFQHVAFKDKDGKSRIKRAYVYSGSGKVKEYAEEDITATSPTTDDSAEDHGTHTASTAGGSSVVVSGSTVSVTDDHASATYGGMAPGADLYLAGINGLDDVYLTSALQRMVNYADNQGKPLVVSNSWGSGWGPRDGTGELAELVGKYFGDDHPNRVILFAASNDAGHRTGSEGGGFFVKKSAVSSSAPLGTIIRTDGEGGDYYTGLIAYAWSVGKLNCKLHVLDNSTGAVKKSWTVTKETTSFSGLSKYYYGSLAIYIEPDNGKYQLVVVTDEDLEAEGDYTLAIEVYPASGSADVDMWAGDWSYFTNHLSTSGYTWTAGTDDMCVSDEATIPDAISVGAYVSKDRVTNAQGQTNTYSSGALGDIVYFSSYATAEQSPTGQSYPWITAPGAQLVAAVNHYDKKGDYSYYGPYKSELVVNSSSSPYGVMEGTSMATPVVAGIVAQWLQAAQEVKKPLTVNDVKDIMRQTAISDSYTTGPNATHFGHGKIDALAGIQYILGTSGSPLIKATPARIDFGSANFATRTYTRTFSVRGYSLDADVNLNLNGSGSEAYGLSATTVTSDEAADGVDITVTYAPQAAGTHEASIVLSSSGAKDVVIPLVATAKPAAPTIIADAESLAFVAGLDQPDSKPIEVAGEFLTAAVTVALADANGVFSVDKSSVTEGALTVTFQSADEGSFTATLTLSSPGAEPVTISLTANASAVTDEVIDFAAQDYENAESLTSTSGTNCEATFGKGTNKNNSPKYYDTGEAARLYGGNTMTIASATNTIIKIELTFGSGDGTNGITTDVGTYDDGTWTGSSTSVTFTVGGTSGHRRIRKVKVFYEGSGGGTTPGSDPDPAVATGSYALVTDAGTLAAGDKILIAYIDGDTQLVLSKTQNTNNRAATDDVTVNSDGTLMPGVEAQVITLEKAGSNYLFNVGDGYLYAASSTKNYMRTESKADANAQATISISDGSATITFQGDNEHNTMRFNPNSGLPIFSCYDSSSSVKSVPQIYRQVTATAPLKGDADGDGDVDVDDIRLTVSHILGQNPTGFSKAAADMDGNNVVDITDLTAIIAVALQCPQP